MMKQRWVYDGLKVKIYTRRNVSGISVENLVVKYDESRNATKEQGIAIIDSLIARAKEKGIDVLNYTFTIKHKKVFETA